MNIDFAVPGTYTIGERFATFELASAHAVQLYRRRVRVIIDSYPPDWPNVEKIAHEAASTLCVIDVRLVDTTGDRSLHRVNVTPED